MAWLELHHSIWTHPKVKTLADALHIDRMLAAAYLIRFWTWAIENIGDENGDITHLDPEDIAIACGWRKNAKKLVDALMDSRWLDRCDGRTFIHDWADYSGGRLFRKRKADRERKRKERAEESSPDDPPSHSSPSPDFPEPVTPDSEADLRGCLNGVTRDTGATSQKSRGDIAVHTEQNSNIEDTNVSSCPGSAADEIGRKAMVSSYDHGSAAYKLAGELSRMIHKNNPSAKIQEERDLQRWAKTAVSREVRNLGAPRNELSCV